MPFTLIQAGTDLQILNTHGELADVPLYSGVTLSASHFPRWVVRGGMVVMVNSPSTPLTIDGTGTVRPLTPKAPNLAPTIAAGSSAGSLSGTYSGVRYTYVIRDINGRLLAESAMSPASNSVTISSEHLLVTGLENSTESAVTGKRIYRPTTNGTVLFPWVEIDGNIITTVQDDLPDSGMSIIAAPTLGNPPRLTLIAEWRNRLWGVGDIDRDELRFSQADAMWSWPPTNGITIPSSGRDAFGIRALMPRREALGIGRRDTIWQITGDTPANFRAIKLSEILGVESQESVVIYRDTVWWLWKDGVYQWDAEGIRSITDQKVKSWFSSDDYFNRGMFPYAFAVFDPNRLKYRVYLAAAGSLSINRWIEYDINTQTWWGPHKTDAFAPTSAFHLIDAEDKVEAAAGSATAYVWREQDTNEDDVATGIPFEVVSKYYDGKQPDLHKMWGQMSILGKVMEDGEVTISGRTGYIGAPVFVPITYDMTLGRESLPRLGTGQLLQFTLSHTTSEEPIEIYGIEVPFSVTGQR